MTVTNLVTLSELIDRISKSKGVVIPMWKLRRVVDTLETRGAITMQRCGRIRLISESETAVVEAELVAQAWAPKDDIVVQSVDDPLRGSGT